MKCISFALALLLLGGSPVRAQDAEPAVEGAARAPTPGPASDEVRRLSFGFNTFALNLHREAADSGDNVVFSPLSVAEAVSLLYPGARGAAAEDIASTLHYPVSGGREIAVLADHARESQVGQVQIANRLWVSVKAPLLPEYAAVMTERFGAAAQAYDFAAPRPNGPINDWVSDKTLGRITNLIPEDVLNADTSMVITNAVYLKSSWAHPFDKLATRSGPFYAAAGRKPAHLMRQVRSLGYRKGAGFQVVSLEMAEPSSLQLVLFVPDERNGLVTMEAGLTADRLNAWLDYMPRRDVDLTLPRFKIETTLPMTGPLKSIGLKRLFEPEVDFSGISRTRTKIDAVLHKAHVAVDEEGAEAAAATAVIDVVVTSARIGPPPPPPAVVRADHPFLFVIRDARTGAIIFMGRMVKPTEESN